MKTTKNQVLSVSLPAKTRTYMPVSNEEMLLLLDDMIEIFLPEFEVEDVTYYLSTNNQRMLANYSLIGEGVEDGLPLSITVKNSYDKSTATAIGTGVNVWHNGVYSTFLRGSDITLFRKHTKHVKDSLSAYMAAALDKSRENYNELLQLVKALKKVNCYNDHAFSLFGLARGYGVIGARSMSKCYDNWAMTESGTSTMWDLSRSILTQIENRGEPEDMMECCGSIGDLVNKLPRIFNIQNKV